MKTDVLFVLRSAYEELKSLEQNAVRDLRKHSKELRDSSKDFHVLQELVSYMSGKAGAFGGSATVLARAIDNCSLPSPDLPIPPPPPEHLEKLCEIVKAWREKADGHQADGEAIASRGDGGGQSQGEAERRCANALRYAASDLEKLVEQWAGSYE